MSRSPAGESLSPGGEPHDHAAVPAPAPGWPTTWFPPVAKRPLAPTLRVAGVLIVATAVSGVPLGLLWRWLSPSTPVVMTRQGPYPRDPQPEQFVAADGWFALLGFGFGLGLALLAWKLLRRHRGPIVLTAVVLAGSAAAVVGWLVGRWPGHAEFVRWKATAAWGTSAAQPPDLRAYGVLLIPAFAAVIAYTLFAGWSHDPELAADPPPADLSSDWSDEPAPTAAPAPPAPGVAAPPPD